MAENQHHHTITDDLKIEFTCNGDRSSLCHQYPDCECETWSEGHPHPMASHDRCWMQDWFDNDGTDPQTETLTDVEYTTGMSGPIWTSFQEDYVEWGFVAETSR